MVTTVTTVAEMTTAAAISNLLAATRNPDGAIPIRVPAIGFAALGNLTGLETYEHEYR